jgi:hypothetical protein
MQNLDIFYTNQYVANEETSINFGKTTKSEFAH